MVVYFVYAFSAPLAAFVFWLALPWQSTIFLFLFVPCLICLLTVIFYL